MKRCLSGWLIVGGLFLATCSLPGLKPGSELPAVQQLTALSATLTGVVAENALLSQTEPVPEQSSTPTTSAEPEIEMPSVGERPILPETVDKLQMLAHWDAKGINCVAFSPDASLIAAGLGDYWSETRENVVQVWDMKTGQVRHIFNAQGSAVIRVVFSPDGQSLVALSEDRQIYVWRLAHGTLVGNMIENKGYLTGAAFSPDGAILAVGVNIPQKNGLLQFWRMADFSLLATYEETYGRVNSPVFSVDGNELSTTSKGIVRIWRVQDGKILRSLEKDVAMVNVAAFSPNGKLLASGSQNGLIQIWSAEHSAAEKGLQYGERLQTLEHTVNSHAVSVTGLEFSKDSQLLVSVGVGGANFWEISRGKMLYSLGDYAISPYSAVFSPDGLYLALAEYTGFAGEGSLQIWGLP